jgi:hypothetical protein
MIKIGDKLICYWQHSVGTISGYHIDWPAEAKELKTKPRINLAGKKCIVLNIVEYDSENNWYICYYPEVNVTYRWATHEVNKWFCVDKKMYFDIFTKVINETA